MKLAIFLLTIVDGMLILSLFSRLSETFYCGVWAGIALMVFYSVEGKVEKHCAK